MIFKKVFLSFSFALGLSFSLMTVEASATFVDVNNSHWASAPIYEYLNKGYIEKGNSPYFYPNKSITRGESLAIASKVLKLPLNAKVNLKAKDLKENHPYYKEILKMIELGVIENAEYINPDQPLKRSEITKILAKAFNIEIDNQNNTRFNDYSSSFWARKYIESLADTDLIKGVGNNKFSPNSYVKRAELISLLSRIEKFKQREANFEVIYDFIKKDYVSTVNDYAQWANDVIYLVNIERAKQNLKPLQHDRQLTQLAIIKVKDMIQQNYFDHTSPIYGSPWDMAMLFDYKFVRFGENIGRNLTSPQAVVNAWINSSDHRKNILNSNYNKIGVGISKTKSGKYYWVQHFSS